MSVSVAIPQNVVHGRSVLDLIGNTPLVGFRRIDAELGGVKVFGKAEYAADEAGGVLAGLWLFH